MNRSKIYGSLLSFLSVDGHLDCRRIEKSMVYRYVPDHECNHAQEIKVIHVKFSFSSAIFSGVSVR